MDWEFETRVFADCDFVCFALVETFWNLREFGDLRLGFLLVVEINGIFCG